MTEIMVIYMISSMRSSESTWLKGDDKNMGSPLELIAKHELFGMQRRNEKKQETSRPHA